MILLWSQAFLSEDTLHLWAPEFRSRRPVEVGGDVLGMEAANLGKVQPSIDLFFHFQELQTLSVAPSCL